LILSVHRSGDFFEGDFFEGDFFESLRRQRFCVAAIDLDEAIEMARGKQGRGASISLFHCPPILMADVA